MEPWQQCQGILRMEWHEITYTFNGGESWIYFKCKPERAKIEGEKKYKSFTYGWCLKTKLKCIKRIRTHEEFTTRKRDADAVTASPKRKRSSNTRTGNPRATKASNRTAKAKSANPKKPRGNEPAASTAKRKPVHKPKPTKSGTTKRVSKRKPDSDKPSTRTTRRSTGVSNTTRRSAKSN